LCYTYGMNAKALSPKALAELSRYTEEELDPRLVEDEAAMEAFILRNRETINRALQEGYDSLQAGEGVKIRSLDDLLAALKSASSSGKVRRR
jgi:hypothetical protein